MGVKRSRVARADKRSLAAIIMILASVVVTGCSSAPQATATPTKTPRVEAAISPAPPTPRPTATLAPPTATATAAATLTPSATPTPTATLTPTLDARLIIPARDPNVSPFTGLRPADPAVLSRRPLAVKLDNDPVVVPQSGMDTADVVVEHRKEGCKTRFTAVYQSQDSERIGSIRSARLVDMELPVIFDAVLAFSGAVGPVRKMLYASDFGDHILEQALNGPAFFRDPNIAVPFNLFANTQTMRKAITGRGWNTPPEPSASWLFLEAPPPGGDKASQLDVPYSEMKVRWTYDPVSGRWLRFMGGKPHINKPDGKQLSAANVVVLGANHVQTLIAEQGTQLTQGPCSNASVEIQLWGEGPLKILRDGQVYEGKWLRPERYAPFRFVDSAGQDIPLKPGNSWWQIVSLDMQTTTAP